MDLHKIDLNLLVALDALLTECSVSAAAERLGVTQPALSHALKRLRLLFGDMLLVRGSRGMQPTDRARALHGPIKAALAELHSILSGTVAFDPATSKRCFRLAMSDVLSVEVLPLVARRLREEAPQIDLMVRAGGPRESCQRIVDDELDLAVGVFPHVPTGLTSRVLYRDRLVCIADRRNPRLRRGRMTMDAFLASPHVTVAPNRDTGIQLDEILDAMGIMRRIAMAVPHYLSVPALIPGTDLVGYAAQRTLSLLRLGSRLAVFPVPLPIQVPELEFIQIWHPRYAGDPGHTWLRDLVLETLRAWSGERVKRSAAGHKPATRGNRT